MSESSTVIGYKGRITSHEVLAFVPTPLATNTHREDDFSLLRSLPFLAAGKQRVLWNHHPLDRFVEGQFL
jgi:hypothetical protein